MQQKPAKQKIGNLPRPVLWRYAPPSASPRWKTPSTSYLRKASSSSRAADAQYTIREAMLNNGRRFHCQHPGAVSEYRKPCSLCLYCILMSRVFGFLCLDLFLAAKKEYKKTYKILIAEPVSCYTVRESGVFPWNDICRHLPSPIRCSCWSRRSPKRPET